MEGEEAETDETILREWRTSAGDPMLRRESTTVTAIQAITLDPFTVPPYQNVCMEYYRPR